MSIYEIEDQGRWENDLCKYLEYNKNDDHYYINLYLDKYKLIVKIPLIGTEKSDEFKIERFSLVNNVYVTSL